MIEFRTLADDHPDLAHSLLLRGALLTLHYAQEQGSIGLTQTKAFKRAFARQGNAVELAHLGQRDGLVGHGVSCRFSGGAWPDSGFDFAGDQAAGSLLRMARI